MNFYFADIKNIADFQPTKSPFLLPIKLRITSIKVLRFISYKIFVKKPHQGLEK